MVRRNCSNFYYNPSWAYRESGAHHLSKKHFMVAELIGAAMWYWIMIHLWHEPEHILVTLNNKDSILKPSHLLIINMSQIILNFDCIDRVISLILIHQNGRMLNLEFLMSNLYRFDYKFNV